MLKQGTFTPPLSLIKGLRRSCDQHGPSLEERCSANMICWDFLRVKCMFRHTQFSVVYLIFNQSVNFESDPQITSSPIFFSDFQYLLK